MVPDNFADVQSTKDMMFKAESVFRVGEVIGYVTRGGILGAIPHFINISGAHAL